MACIIKVNRHGYLAYRLFWRGMKSWEGTGLKDTPKNREKMQRRADPMSDEMAEGTFDYLKWFATGNKASRFRPAPPSVPARPVTVREYAEQTWLPRKVPPLVRATLADTYRCELRRHILAAFGDRPLVAVTSAALEDFRSLLTRAASDGGKGLKVKTARCIIDGTFRALYRDARETDHLVTTDPFAALRWPRLVKPEPDPFDEAERDRLLDYFSEKGRHYYPLVYVQFFSGMRTGEVVGLRRGDLDLRKGELTVRRSRTMGEDNAPKTKRSHRTLTLLPGVIAVLRAMPSPLHATDEAFLFTTPTGRPLDEERFVEKHWHRALRATGVRPRKFYATRHTFISVALSKGANLKWVARYCGTSVEMIDEHYGKWLGDDGGQLALLAPGSGKECPQPRAVSDTGGATFGATFREPSKNVGTTIRRGGDSNSVSAMRALGREPPKILRLRRLARPDSLQTPRPEQPEMTRKNLPEPERFRVSKERERLRERGAEPRALPSSGGACEGRS